MQQPQPGGVKQANNQQLTKHGRRPLRRPAARSLFGVVRTLDVAGTMAGVSQTVVTTTDLLTLPPRLFVQILGFGLEFGKIRLKPTLVRFTEERLESRIPQVLTR